MSKLFIFLLLISVHSQAQDRLSAIDTTDFLSTKPAQINLRQPTDESLLPSRMLFTQRIFWGFNGVLRATNIAPLTRQGRQKEVKVRQFMLVAHQATGYITLAGLLMQGLLATQLARASATDYDRLYSWQQTTTTITNIAYGTTALLSLTAPPKLATDRKKASGIRLHQYLSIVHLTGFIATNILTNKAAQHSELRPYQQAAAFTTFAAFAPALVALKF